MDDMNRHFQRQHSSEREHPNGTLPLTRRAMLRAGGLSLLASALTPGPMGWLDAGVARAFTGVPRSSAQRGVDPLLVVIFLRGGADGLHLAPPAGDPHYARVRESLALDDALSFAGPVGLHPKLVSLKDLVAEGNLAVIHAVGSHHPTRSHFEAQDFMEAGEPANARVLDGWMTRALRGSAKTNVFASLALASELPLSLRGSGSFAIAHPRDFGLPRVSPAARQILEALYAGGGDDPLESAGRRALDAVEEMKALRVEPTARRRRRRPRRAGRAGLVDAARHLAELDAAGVPVRAVALESSGWDTHSHQGTAEGPMARSIEDLGDAMASIFSSLGHRDPTLVVMTEFGRTVRPNGSGGTDHGHGSVMFVAGRSVAGGLFGATPGLRANDLYEGRDLAVTTDYRSVLYEVIGHHLGGDPPPGVFPGFRPVPLGLFGSSRA